MMGLTGDGLEEKESGGVQSLEGQEGGNLEKKLQNCSSGPNGKKGKERFLWSILIRRKVRSQIERERSENRKSRPFAVAREVPVSWKGKTAK